MTTGEKVRPSRRPLVLLLLAALGGGAYAVSRYRAAHGPLEIGGTVEMRSVQVASRTGGRVRGVPVREGDRVRAGQVLVALETADLQARYDESQGAVELAQAQLDRVVRGMRPEEIAAYEARQRTAQAALSEVARGARAEDVARARAQLASSESHAAMAGLTLDRTRTLFGSGSVSRAELDTATAQLAMNEANRDAARNALAALVNGSRAEDVAQARSRLAEATAQLQTATASAREEDVRVARAQLAQARARLAQAAVNLAEASVTAPADCVVEALDLRPGDILAPNQTAATLVEDDQMFVRAYVPETELGHVRVGASVPFTVDTFPGRQFHATVQHVNEVGEYTPRNLQTADERADQVFLVRLGLRECRDRLRAGMAATVLLPREPVGGR